MKNIHDNTLLHQQVTSWQVILDEIKFENIRLKNLLAEAISKNVSRSFVEEAEAFQQKFLDKEQVADLLRHDISSMMAHTGDPVMTGLQSASLERDIVRLHTEITQLKSLFHVYLASKTDHD